MKIDKSTIQQKNSMCNLKRWPEGCPMLSLRVTLGKSFVAMVNPHLFTAFKLINSAAAPESGRASARNNPLVVLS